MMKAVCGKVLRAPFTTIAEPVKFVKCMDRMKDFPRAAAWPQKNYNGAAVPFVMILACCMHNRKEYKVVSTKILS